MITDSTLEGGALVNGCNLCGGRDASVLANRSRNGQPLRTVICNGCGLVWSDPFPHDARQFYAEDYRLDYKGSFEPQPRHVMRAGEVALSRLRQVEWLFSQPRKVLDIGSGGGEFAYLLTARGHTVKGIEPNRGYAEYSRREYGLDVTVGFAQDIELPAASFDVITIWHVLEHTQDPLSVLKRLQGWLRPDGMLVVEVPNVEATCQAPGSTFHEAHLYNFSTDTLSAMAARAGFVIEESALSSDGGNITMIVRKSLTAVDNIEQCVARCSPHRILQTVQNRSVASHYQTLSPYSRMVSRVSKSLRERIEVRRFNGARAFLDGLYAGRR